MARLARHIDPRSSAPLTNHGLERVGLLLTCAIVGLIGGYVGGAAERATPWSELAIILAIPVGALIVAAAVLRALEAFSLRGRIFDDVAHSRELSMIFRATLEERFPGVAARAHEIDAAGLVERALGSDRRSEPRSTPGRKADV